MHVTVTLGWPLGVGAGATDSDLAGDDSAAEAKVKPRLITAAAPAAAAATTTGTVVIRLFMRVLTSVRRLRTAPKGTCSETTLSLCSAAMIFCSVQGKDLLDCGE
ncbi:hypothetical protein ACFVH6_07975 [Spirillospora sp. NPDC127200]